jgi:hypothetical protein
VKSIRLRDWEVRAIQNGATQIRRLITNVAGHGKVRQFQQSITPGYDWQFRCRRGLWQDYRNAELVALSPFGKPGDVLWVKETWGFSRQDDDINEIERVVCYAAGHPYHVTDARVDKLKRCRSGELMQPNHFVSTPDRWRPSTQMPRWASRLELVTKAVRAERVQEISEKDAVAMGVVGFKGDREKGCKCPACAKDDFVLMWTEAHDPDSWNRNDYVWVGEIERKDVGE